MNMFGGRTQVINRNKSKKHVQRAALFFIAAVLVFTLAEPGISSRLADLVTNKQFNSQAKLNSLASIMPQEKAVLSEDALGMVEQPVNNPRDYKYEEVDKRTEHTSTYVNNDGTRTLKYTVDQQNYKKGDSWQKIDNTLTPITQPAPQPTFWQNLTGTAPKAPDPERFVGRAGSIGSDMKRLSEGVTVRAAGKTIVVKPVGARDVTPEQKDKRSVIYRDAWPYVDLVYELRGEAVKEIIIIKDKRAQTNFNFSVSGGTVINHPSRPGELSIKGMPEEFSFSSLTLDVNGRGVISEQRVSQSPQADGKGIAVVVDKDWLKSQPIESFPMRIDPSFAKATTSYWMFKSDGYSCNGNNCYANIGTLNDNGWKHWRSYVQFPYNELAGKKILNATLDGYFIDGVNGETGGRNIRMGHANCISFHCIGRQVGWASGVSTNFSIDFTAGMQAVVNARDFGAVWSLHGEEGPYKSYKPYYDIVAYVVYDSPTPVAPMQTPADKQVIVDTQPTLQVGAVSDPDGPVQYQFTVSTNPDGQTGAVVNSNWSASPVWSVPEGVLQDGTTYYWRVKTRDTSATGQVTASGVRSFKIDLRTGKDSTQSYDTVGPVGIDLATGNATLSDDTHTMNALGGSMGLTLNYNTPNRANHGLTAEYWNLPAGYSFGKGAPSGSPALKRREQSVNYNWDMGSPAPGVVNADWFYVRWTGQFVAPTTGEYKFGGSNDDSMQIKVDGQIMYRQGCYTGICYATDKKVHLRAGQAVPISVEFEEGTSKAYARVYVKGAVKEQAVPQKWLRADVVNQPQSYGLTGRYYTDNNKQRDLAAAVNDSSRLMMVRRDTKMNLQFGGGGPAPGLQIDNFMARWTGYITVPTAGSYILGAQSDDGVRIRVNTGSWKTLLDRWNYQASTAWGSAITLPANTPIPIQVDWYENGGSAHLNLRIKGNGYEDQEIPVTWLTPDANVLPEQWKLGIDADGDIGYDRIRISNNSVVLEDSTGGTHEYTYTGSGYKPPVNEDGTLTKNSDNTYTFLDTDGRTYIFDAAGQLISLTSPTDDRNPAALKYTYAGSPSRLVKIEDGTTSSRFATVYYKGVNEENNICDKNGTNNPSGLLGFGSAFDDAPAGKLCAFKTSDGDTTNFYYKDGQLVRIVKPGGDITDYAYDEFGRITKVRDSLAADAVRAGLRADDDSVTTQLSYDSLGRIQAVTAPAATTDAARLTHTLSYTPGQTDLHISGASESLGYSRRIGYDSLLRTTSESDLTGKTTQTEWDPVKDLQLSTTDATGLKSTTIYNDDDMPIEQFGPAPSAWFGNDRRPLAAQTANVPRTSTSYDENLKGPAVSWYRLKGANMTLTGTPIANTIGFASNGAPENGNPAYLRHAYGSQPLPFEPSNEPGVTGYGFVATGKFTAPQTGAYTFTIHNDDSATLQIDDKQIFSNWGKKTANDVTNAQVGTFAAVAGKSYRFQLRYGYDGNAKGRMGLAVKGPGIADTMGDGTGTRDWSSYLKPGYGLQTTQKAYDAQAGNIETKTIYKNPAYGQIEKTVLDPGGLNYESKAEYEAPGAGYLRQTSKTLPGGAKTTYEHYNGSDMRDNPCTPESDPAPQAGRPKGKVEPDPDGDGPQQGRSSETIYNHAGDIVATRYNNDSWTCTEYDTRGRVVRTIVPDRTANGQTIKGRTITNNYALNGNPLITTTTDESGTITVENDLLGRTIKYTDAKGHTTLNTYDDFGKLTKRTSPLGTETYEYDQFDRLVKHKLDGVTFATVVYDEFSDIQKIDYPAGIQLSSITRDSLGRENGNTYTLASGQTLSDQIERYVSGDIKQGVELGVQKSYTYDNAGRLTNAKIGDNNFSYEFSTPHESCAAVSGYNPNTAKSGNRTKLTMNGEAITFCYDQADRLVTASDPSLTNAKYDSHGNTIRLGDDAHTTHFTYDASDRNTAIRSGDKQTHYTRDAQDRILSRTHTQPNAPDSTTHYGFTGSGDTPDFTTDAAGNITQKHLTLPGDVLVTIKPNIQSAGATTFSLPNLHGDIFATINADGSLTSTFMTGPFGEHLPNQITQPPNTLAPTQTPLNTTSGTSWHYVGQHQKLTETESSTIPGGIIQMGARVYLPILGRFLQVDPVEGGTDNSYVYANDPVNSFDLDGKAVFIPVAMFVGRIIVQHAAKQAVKRGLTQLAVNRIKGRTAERVAYYTARIRYPRSKIIQPKSVKTPYGRRYSDLRVIHRSGRSFRIEVKAGRSRYLKSQRKKDAYIYRRYGERTRVWRY